GPLLEIDHLGAAALQLEHVGVLPGRDDALPSDRDRFRDRETVVDRDDPAVHEYRIGGVGRECGCNRGKPKCRKNANRIFYGELLRTSGFRGFEARGDGQMPIKGRILSPSLSIRTTFI